MKNAFFSLIIIILTATSTAALDHQKLNNTKWHVKGITNTEYLFNLKLNDGKFSLASRKGSTKNIMKSMYHLALLMGKVNSNAILIKGDYYTKDDTLFMKGDYKSLTTTQTFEGFIYKDSLSAQLSRNAYSGSRIDQSAPLKPYFQIAKAAIEHTENYLYNPEILNSKKWKDFKRSVLKRSKTVLDDYEFSLMYNNRVRSLPFSHYGIQTSKKKKQTLPNQDKQQNKKFDLKRIDAQTALFTIHSFAASAEEIMPFIDTLKSEDFENLIIDLRNNSGGSISSALPLSSYLVKDTMYGGLFLTQKYFSNNKEVPSPEDYNQFPLFSEASFQLILDGIHKEKGLCLIIYPESKTFDGNLYVLTNNNTASACEPLVYGLKSAKRAVVVGEKTSGQMLNGEQFQIADNMVLWIPTADFYTADGFRIDKVGVSPNVEIESKMALDHTLQMIKGDINP